MRRIFAKGFGKLIGKGAVVVAAMVCAGLLLGPEARAEWPPPDDDNIDLSDPQYWPNDPGYANQWNYWSWIHEDARSAVQAYAPHEIAVGSGFHADRAWQKTIGDRRVVIAVLDSGIRWHHRDLVNKFYLNAGELPAPDDGCGGDGSTYDVNADNIFNVQDYTANVGHERPTQPCDSRILAHNGGDWDTNGNGHLDPQDLIAIFSDEIDDDGNGYVDDISGWDFYTNDNDPHDDTDFGHGSGEARDSAAEGNNGDGSLGVCPECTLLMVRAGESFVVDGNDFAMGVIFAVDSGASVIQEALGAINNTKLSQDAINYAYYNDVTVIGSAADEDSFHHNFPGTNNHTIYVHAIQFDSTSYRTAKTYQNYCNCTNYGAQLVLSTPGTGCSSEATGRTAGIVGLIYAMALKENIPFPDGAPKPTDIHGARRLRADEVKQLLATTVTDIHDPNAATDPERYATREGWEMRFGYGRPNIGDAVRQIEAGRIPPVVDVVSPYWFHPLYPAREPGGIVPITGEISFRSDIYDSYDYVIEWAPGIEPDDSDFTTIDSGTGVTENMTGTLADWDVSGITVDNPPQPPPDREVNRYMVTLRIRVTANSADSSFDGVQAEMRKGVFLVRDPDLLPGFPIFIGASGEGSPKTADIDGDGVREIVYPDADGYVHVIKGDGSYVPGWPTRVNLIPHLDALNPANHRDASAYAAHPNGGIDPDVYSSIVGAPAIADMDADGEVDIVVASLDGFVYAYDADGNIKTGFPVELDRDLAANPTEDNNVDSGIFGAPVLYDLDGDGTMEIIVGAYDGHVYVWHHDGALDEGFPVKLSLPTDTVHARTLSSPAIGDVDGDGQVDIVIGSGQTENEMGSWWVIHSDGNSHAGGPYLDGFPVKMLSLELLPLLMGIFTSPALADIDGDGQLEIAISGTGGPPQIFRGNGRLYRAMENGTPGDPTRSYGPASPSEDMPMQVVYTSPIFADFNNDGRLNLLQGGGGLKVAAAFASGGKRIDFDHLLGAWDAVDGRFLYAYPQIIDDWQFFQAPAVADIDGDDIPEVIAGSAGYYVRAWNRLGEQPDGWPKFTGGWIITAPAVGDINGDGNLEVVVGSRNGWLFAWSTTGSVDGRIEWESYKHDNQNTGNYHHPLQQGTRDTLYDDDLDDDGTPNESDGDVDGDGVYNQDDDDIDGDGVPNDWDYDDDGDGINDADDDTPQGVIGKDDEGGCGCAAGASADAGLPLMLLLGLLFVGLRRRRRQ